MNVVLDTNVLVSGLLTPFSPCGEIVRMIPTDHLTLCLDARLLGEYAEVLHRPRFQFDEELVSALLDHIAHTGLLIAAGPLSQALPDTDDEAFLEVALAAQAECLITGNLKYFPPRLRQGVNVLSPQEFLTHFRRKRPKS